MTAPWMSSGVPGRIREGGETDAAHVGLVTASEKDGQASGDLSAHLPCVVFTAALFDALTGVKDACITGPEKRAVDDCLQAARDVYARFGGAV